MSDGLGVVGAFSVFGKVPVHGDFLHAGEAAPARLSFDDWLTGGVEWAHARAGAAWCEAFRTGGVRAFVFRVADRATRPATYVVGALAPSQDQAGRLFPISVAATVALTPEYTRQPQLLPFACEEIWQSAGECVAQLGASAEPDLAERIAALQPAQDLSAAEAQAAYASWGEGLPLYELWALICASQDPDQLRDTLQFIAAAVQPYRNVDTPNTQLSLRLPLGAAGGAALCFWLDVVRRLAGWSATVPSFFWSHEGAGGQLTVHLGTAPVATVSELWLPSVGRDEFCDLTAPMTAAVREALPALPGAVLRALAPSASVASLLAAL